MTEKIHLDEYGSLFCKTDGDSSLLLRMTERESARKKTNYTDVISRLFYKDVDSSG